MKESSEMDLFCRGCLKNFDDLADLLQYTEESRRLFIYSTGLQVKRNDVFTFQLCKECYYSMKSLCKFKKMCRTSDKQIKSFLALKDVDEGLDFSTFIKRHEESITFRLPMLNEDSTSAKQKIKDDDNESTCTSIQNFMTDLLRAEEIPDSEARIIREVIEEEADVLEDSLDSHWLQDDNSMDSDFELNFSLKQFLTPHSSNNDHMYSSDYREITSNDVTSGEDYDNIQIDNAFEEISDPMDSSYIIETDENTLQKSSDPDDISYIIENDNISIKSPLHKSSDPEDIAYAIENDNISIENTLQKSSDPVDISFVIDNDNIPIESILQKNSNPENISYAMEADNIPIESTLQKTSDPEDISYVIETVNIPIENTLQKSSDPVDIAYVIENDNIPIESILQKNSNPDNISYAMEIDNIPMESTLQKTSDPEDISYVIDTVNIPIESTLRKCSDPEDISYVIENDNIPIESTLQKCSDPEDIAYVIKNDNIPIESNLQSISDPAGSSYVMENNNIDIESTLQKISDPVDVSYVIENDNIPIETAIKKVPDPVDNSYLLQDVCDVDIENDANNSSCAIDINLEKALRDENNQEFSLEEILASPSVFTKASNLSPARKQVGFGKSANGVKKNKSPKFESDLDLLMGKLNNVKTNGRELREEKMKIKTSIIENVKKNKGSGKPKKKKSKLRSAKKVRKFGKLTLDQMQKGMAIKDQLITEEFLKGKTNLENLNVVTLKDGNLDLAVFDVGQIQNGNLGIEVLNIGEIHETNLDLRNINIEILQDIENCKKQEEEHQKDNVLEEFLILHKDESREIRKEEDQVNIDCEVQIHEEVVMELPGETTVEDKQLQKDKKSLPDKSPKKDRLFRRESKSSSIENKYCITNFYCKMCNKKFKNLSALKMHFARFHQYQIVTPKKARPATIKICEICSRTFTTTNALLRHLTTHKSREEEFSCEHCTLTFRSENALKTHVSIHMSAKRRLKPKDSNSRYVCNICGAISTSSSNHLTHLRRHSKSYTLHCDECGRGFYRTTELEVHMRLHTGEKPFGCLYCDRSFNRRDCLNRHLKCHTEEKPFDCQYCGRTFAKRYDIKVHQSYNKYCLKIREKLVHQNKVV